MAHILFKEHSSAPGTPDTGKVAMYAKANGRLYSKADDGIELALEGETGPAGVAGSQVTAGSGAPSNGSGSDGDFYFRTDTMHFYTKAAGTWSDGGAYIATIPVTLGGTGLTSCTTGDILYGSASNTLSKLAIGEYGQTLRIASTGLPTWMSGFDPSIETELFEDFTTNNSTNSMSGLSVSGSSSGLASNVSLMDANHPGVYQIQTGSSSASGASYVGVTTNHAMVFSGGVAQSRFGFQYSRLSDAAQEYRSRIGWYDDVSQTDSTVDGVYFYYDRAATGDFWVLRTSNNSTQTSVTSSIAVVANSWIYLYIHVNTTGTLATFYVNGVSAGTISTNIPTGLGRGAGLMFGIHKTVGTGTDSFINMDYMWQRKTFTTPRA